jgi:hypothetical protein
MNVLRPSVKRGSGSDRLFVADVVHMTCKQQTTAREDLQTVVQKLLHIEFTDGTMNHPDKDSQFTETTSLNKKHSEVFHT